MDIFRIICKSDAKKDGFCEKLTAPLRQVGNDVYYTDYKGRSWSCTYEYLNGRIITDPEIVSVFSAPLNMYRFVAGTGSAYQDPAIPSAPLRAANPGLVSEV